MGLTPEQRRRIYEEEKARIEAKVQIPVEMAARAKAEAEDKAKEGGEAKTQAQAPVRGPRLPRWLWQPPPSKSQAQATLRPDKAEPRPNLVSPLPGKLQRGLGDNLYSSESIEVCLNPDTGQAIVVTDRRVLIIKAGGYWTRAGWFAARTKSFPFAEISSVDLRVGPLGGHLKISVAGTPQAPDVNIVAYDMMKTENAVTFNFGYKETMKIVAGIIRSKVEAAHGSASVGSTRDLAAQLTDLTRLRGAGVLTEAEFAQAKARLLTG
jgi:hypothetical protein